MHGWELQEKSEDEKKMFNIHFTLFDRKNTVTNFLGYLNSSYNNIKRCFKSLRSYFTRSLQTRYVDL